MSDKAIASPLTLDVVRAGNALVVHCNGKLVAGVNDILYVKVSQLMPDTKRIVLDLTNLSRVDSMGLGTLVRVYVSCRSAGCSLELVNLGKQVRQLLGTTNLLSVFAIVGEHGEQRFALGRRCLGSGRQNRTEADQVFGFSCRAIPYRDLMSGAHQIGGDGRTHLAKPDEADFHLLLH